MSYSPVPELNLLKEFEDGLDGYYSGGFFLDRYGENEFLGDPELVARFIPFARPSTAGPSTTPIHRLAIARAGRRRPRPSGGRRHFRDTP
ncbi:hypothetical protein OG292_11650 [Streptomyces sp. NBC_01511]|uniref:hypothetical protein n=1 Tax=unclassified Streptomyces TaxID=2593676 RepID=UPI003863EF6C